MKRFAIATFGILLATVPAARADDTSCEGVLSNITIKGNLVVPKGASCTLSLATVTGNVEVGAGASLGIVDNVTIGGNIQADRCAAVSLSNLFGDKFVGGNLHIRRCTGTATENGYGSFGTPITISGNFTCENNLSPCVAARGSVGGNVRFNNNSGGGSGIHGNTIAGNVQVNLNSGGSSEVGGNNIGGNLDCAGNTGVTDLSGANTVAGKKQGQCAGL